MKENNAVYILGCEAKDLYEGKRMINPVIEKGVVQGYICKNLARYKNTLDYSLDLIKLREVAVKRYRNNRGFFVDAELDKEFTRSVICVNFNLSYKEFNKHGELYIRDGYAMSDVKAVGKFDDMTFFDGETCIAVKVGNVSDDSIPVKWNETIPEYFEYDEDAKKIKLVKTIPTIMNCKELREDLYKNGFTCNGIEFVRYKRSSGSSRVGKCLFIDKRLYKDMHKWELCGLNIKEGSKLDLAGFESYISLPSSSCIDTLTILPENILIIDDYESEFEDDVISVYGEGENFVAKEERVKIKNSIFDGQSLMDISLYDSKYTTHSMLLLRNRFFKSACFKTRIQDWFRDNGITDVSQLNGYTRAKSIEDIKLITTKSSIKYCKFGTIEQWLDNLHTTFGIVKYEKPTKYLDGRMVQCHYQLLNTLQLTREDIDKLLKPNLDYLNLIRKDAAVMRYHLKYPYALAESDEGANNKDEIVMKVLGMNSKFFDTKMFNDFRKDLTKAMLKNYRNGHIWISGNYETLLGNGIEMLQQAIGTFNGESVIGVGNIHTKRFEYGTRLLGTRSPHINSGNVLLANNVANDLIDKYFVMSREIVYINAIGENILQRLNGCDFDSDAMLITDNKILIEAAEKNYRRFKVPTCFVEAKKIKHRYTAEDKTKLDIRTSVNKIGEIINLSQYLNSVMWENIYNDMQNGVSEDEAFTNQNEIYKDICILACSSSCEIDSAKREFDVNIGKTLDNLKKKYAVYTEIDGKLKYTKPMFFRNITVGNGYSVNPNQHMRFFETPMDYLQKALDKFRADRMEIKKLSISDILAPCENWVNPSGLYARKVRRIIEEIKDMKITLNSVYAGYNGKSKEERECVHAQANIIKTKYIKSLSKVHLSATEVYMLLKELDKDKNASYSRFIFNTLFSTGNKSFYDAIRNTSGVIYKLTKKRTDESVELFEIPYFKQIIKNEI